METRRLTISRATSKFQHPLRHVVCTVVQHAIGAGVTRVLQRFVSAGCADHVRTGGFRPLHRVVADPPASTSDEDRLSTHIAIGEHAAVCGHRRDAEASAGREVHVFREGYGSNRRQRDILGGGAETALVLRLIYPCALADPRLRYAVAYCVNHSSTVAVRDDVTLFYSCRL